MNKSIRDLMGDSDSPSKIVLFQEVHDRALMDELATAIQRVLPQAFSSSSPNGGMSSRMK